MTSSNPNIGSTFDSWLDEEGIREEVENATIKAVLAHQLAASMATQGLSKKAMADAMKTSRAQLDRLLDPDNSSVTLDTMQRAARIVGRQLRIELV